MINIEDFRELIESMDIIAENKLKMASQFYYCLVKSVSNNKCTIVFNNKEYIVPFYGGSPKANKTYAVFLPQNNMNQAFVVGEGASGGSGGSGIAIQPDPPTGDELVWIDTDDPGTQHIIPEIDDESVSLYDTWSSSKIRDFIYPIGSIYMSVNNISPATIFGGTWEQIEDRFLLAAGTTYTAGDTGGEAAHTLTDAELPATSGSFRTRRMSWGTGASSSAANVWSPSGKMSITSTGTSGTDSVAYYTGVTRGYETVGFSFGSDTAHNNMPPYLAVYIWKRTA